MRRIQPEQRRTNTITEEWNFDKMELKTMTIDWAKRNPKIKPNTRLVRERCRFRISVLSEFVSNTLPRLNPSTMLIIIIHDFEHVSHFNTFSFANSNPLHSPEMNFISKAFNVCRMDARAQVHLKYSLCQSAEVCSETETSLVCISQSVIEWKCIDLISGAQNGLRNMNGSKQPNKSENTFRIFILYLPRSRQRWPNKSISLAPVVQRHVVNGGVYRSSTKNAFQSPDRTAYNVHAMAVQSEDVCADVQLCKLVLWIRCA